MGLAHMEWEPFGTWVEGPEPLLRQRTPSAPLWRSVHLDHSWTCTASLHQPKTHISPQVCARYPNYNNPPVFPLYTVEITPKGKPLEGVYGVYFADHFKLNWVYPHSALAERNQKKSLFSNCVLVYPSHTRIFEIILPLQAHHFKTPQDFKTSIHHYVL